MTFFPSPPLPTGDSLHELRDLCARFSLHTQNFKDWLRQGGSPIDPVWAVETITLRRELHRAQCRAARRVYDAEQETPTRCLGALQVYRVQQLPPQPPLEAQEQGQEQRRRQQRSRHREELAACNRTGKFERFGDEDIAFVCDFCDGYLVWDDLREMPSIRAGALPPGGDSREPLSTSRHQYHSKNGGGRRMAGPGVSSATTTITTSELTATMSNNSSTHGGYNNSYHIHNHNNNHNAAQTTTPATTTTAAAAAAEVEEEAAGAPDQWQATGFARTDGSEKTIVFAPVAIANHRSPEPGEWQARVLCPFCDEYYYEETGDDEVERTRYTQDEGGFESVADFHDHLAWYHTSLLPNPQALLPTSVAGRCAVM